MCVCDTYSDLDLLAAKKASTASKSNPVSGPKELAKAQAPEMDLPNVSCRGVDVFQDIKDGMNWAKSIKPMGNRLDESEP